MQLQTKLWIVTLAVFVAVAAIAALIDVFPIAPQAMVRLLKKAGVVDSGACRTPNPVRPECRACAVYRGQGRAPGPGLDTMGCAHHSTRTVKNHKTLSL